MTVNNVMHLLRGAAAVYIVWGGIAKQIDPDDVLEMDAFGQYIVDRVAAHHEPNTFELLLSVAPIKSQA